jgi:hypothetical protein
MIGDDELARLEAERARLLSVMAHQKRMMEQAIPAWFRFAMLAMVVGIGIALLAGLMAGQIALSGIFWSIGIIGLSVFVGTRKIRLFGARFYVWEFIMETAVLPPVGERQPRELLADCEARIAKLKESRS